LLDNIEFVRKKLVALAIYIETTLNLA